MEPMRATLLALAVAVGLSSSAFAAGTVELAIHDGRVDLKASNASVSQILTEWARVGGTRVENAERLNPVPVTLQFEHAPESQALAILLRSAAGFIAVPRQSASVGPSQFARILILASSTPPPATAAAPARPSAPPFAAPPPFAQAPPMRVLPSGARPILGPDGRPVADDQDGAAPPPTPVTSMPPGFSPPPPAAPVPPPPSAPAAAPGAVGGSAVPGAIVKPPPQRRPGGGA